MTNTTKTLEGHREWIDRFYALYEEGRKKEKAPVGYIDYFKVREFILKEIDSLKDPQGE